VSVSVYRQASVLSRYFSTYTGGNLLNEGGDTRRSVQSRTDRAVLVDDGHVDVPVIDLRLDCLCNDIDEEWRELVVLDTPDKSAAF
jgi:hypothetical protein